MINCPFCNLPMVLRETKKYRHRDGSCRKFYVCQQYGICFYTIGAHPNGVPMGIPGDDETKAARIAAHDALDFYAKAKRLSRNQTYKFMANLMEMSREEAHIGKFTKQQCAELIHRIFSLA